MEIIATYIPCMLLERKVVQHGNLQAKCMPFKLSIFPLLSEISLENLSKCISKKDFFLLFLCVVRDTL